MIDVFRIPLPLACKIRTPTQPTDFFCSVVPFEEAKPPSCMTDIDGPDRIRQWKEGTERNEEEPLMDCPKRWMECLSLYLSKRLRHTARCIRDRPSKYPRHASSLYYPHKISSPHARISSSLLPHAVGANETAQRAREADDAVVEVDVAERRARDRQVAQVGYQLRVGDGALSGSVSISIHRHPSAFP